MEMIGSKTCTPGFGAPFLYDPLPRRAWYHKASEGSERSPALWLKNEEIVHIAMLIAASTQRMGFLKMVCIYDRAHSHDKRHTTAQQKLTG